MQIALTAEQVRLQGEFAEYFSSLMTDELLAELGHHHANEAYRAAVRQMGKDGYLAVGWPKEYGGRGYGPVEQMIFVREALRANAPLPFLSLSTVGPTLMRFGSAEQKAMFLPGIAEGRLHFSIGYTEASSGTDLASLQTRAVREGEEFVVNGSKIYTSLAEGADYIWLAARTDPDAYKHRGISVLIVDTKSPGFSYTPIETVASMRTNTTYYSDVRVPATMLVGELNEGWKLITSQLNFERIGIAARAVHGERLYAQVLEWARQPDEAGRLPFDRPGAARLLALTYTQLELLWLLNFRMAWGLGDGAPDPALASAAKVHGVHSLIEVCRNLLQVVGTAGLLRSGSRAAALRGVLEYEYRKHQNSTFGGGSAEVLRDLVAHYGLGMPKAKR